MNDGLFYGFLIVVIFIAGAVFGANEIEDSVGTNTLQGYHCQPITKHSTLEDAKAQVELYQERAGK